MKYELADIGSLGPDRVLLGAGQGGPTIWDRRHKAHCLVSGENGSGKGGTMRTMQCHDVTAGNTIVVLAPDPGEYGWLRDVATVATEDDAPEALAAVVDEMDRRRDQLATFEHNGITGADSWQALPDPPPWLAVYIDETPALLGDEAAITYGLKTVNEMTRLVASIVKRGRKVRVSLVLATQYPTLEGTFGRNPLGGSIRANLPARIHCDRDPESLHAAFRAGQRIPGDVLAHLDAGIPGRVAYSFLNPDDRGRVIAGQIMWVTPTDAHALTHRKATR